LARDIDKEKKDQRKAEVTAMREVRKQQVLQTVLRAKDLNEAAQHLDTSCDELKKRILGYGVKRNYREVWSLAVKDYLDAGQPYQYEMNVTTLEEFVDKPSRYLNFAEKDIQVELLLEEKLQQPSKFNPLP
jgi:vacuolar-type H+-ATPase subunit I/STV1